jgi:hypothetical protein
MDDFRSYGAGLPRRSFLRTAAVSSASCVAAGRLFALEVEAAPERPYRRANTDWLANCRFGMGVHWTARTAPMQGRPRAFQAAVDAFDLAGFVAAVEHAGADYVLFTAVHALQMLPAPHPVIDRILPGRTCQRDLIRELAEALAVRGKHLLVYYNHSCNQNDDPAWEQAVGYHGQDMGRFARNLIEIVSWSGERYGERLKAWWFDSPYSVDPRGPHNSVTTDLRGFQFPWEEFTVAAKAGHPGRLVTYNPGIHETFLYTRHQDYWAGEMTNLDHPAASRYLSNGLQWFGWTCLEDRAWVHTKLNTPIPPPLYSDQQLRAFVQACHRRQAPMTFNVGIYQEGVPAPASIEQLHRLKAALLRA